METHYFGCCTECCKDGCDLKKNFCGCNIGRNHWEYCELHKQAWQIGSNLFSSWREENDEIWEANWNKIKDYTVVDEEKS